MRDGNTLTAVMVHINVINGDVLVLGVVGGIFTHINTVAPKLFGSDVLNNDVGACHDTNTVPTFTCSAKVRVSVTNDCAAQNVSIVHIANANDVVEFLVVGNCL